VFVSLGLMGLALLLVSQPALAVALAGLASAVFHVGGGTLAIGLARGRATGLGVFAAPGVIGLACGGALAVAGYASPIVLLLPLVVVSVGLALLSRSISIERSPADMPALADRDSIVLALLSAIALRSALWSAFEWVLKGNLPMVLAAALAAGTGKVVGGVLADRLGWRRWAIGSLAVAAPLLAIGPGSGLAFLIGLALLQSATPVTFAAVARLLPERPGVAAGLSVGLAIAVGGLFVFSGLGSYIASPLFTLGSSAASGARLWWALRRNSTRAVGRRPPIGELAGER
jgi:FSR family fosmidomycin resistance protein-like MFS transporter